MDECVALGLGHRGLPRVGREPAGLFALDAAAEPASGEPRGDQLLLVASDIAANEPRNAYSLAIGIFLLSMAVTGVASAFVGSAPAAVVGDIMGGRRGGIVVAAYQMVSDLGAIVAPLLAGALVDALDFDWAFATGAAVAVMALLLVLAMPETLRRHATTDVAGPPPSTGDAPQPDPPGDVRA